MKIIFFSLSLFFIQECYYAAATNKNVNFSQYRTKKSHDSLISYPEHRLNMTETQVFEIQKKWGSEQ